MGARIRAYPWHEHPLGPPAQWPEALQMAMALCLHSTFPTAIYWGPQLHVLYNDAWSVIPAERHPAILGQPAREAWSDIWHVVGPQFERVLATGQGEAAYGQMLPMVRGGRTTETWWNYSLTAIRSGAGPAGGIFNQGNEITDVVRARARGEAELARWRVVFQQAPAGIALLRGPRHVFEFANDAYLRLVGSRQVVGLPVEEALPEIAGQGFTELLDSVAASGEPYVGTGRKMRLQRRPDGPVEDCVLDFVYHPVRDAAGDVAAIFVLVTDVTDRAKAEAALRVSNWQLGEERARLAALIEAEQRAQQALRRFNETLEGHVRQRTAQLTQALDKESALAHRLRASFETRLLFQGYLDADGMVLDSNPYSLEAIGCTREQVLGRPFWDTPWFTGTPGMGDRVRAAVAAAQQGQAVAETVELALPAGRRRFLLSLRPVLDAAGQVVGLVPEGLPLDPPA